MSKERPCQADLMGKPVSVKRVDEVRNPMDFLQHCMPAFGGAYVRRICSILDRAIGENVPLVLSVAGPVTVSNQHRCWLNPLLETGWFAYVTSTDACCYHDGHDSLQAFKERPLREVPLEGSDELLAELGIIRVTDVGFPEDILFQQDRFFSALLQLPEFQKRMTGTEFRNRIGKYFEAQERANGVAPGLLATCYKNGIPFFVGAPGDGSVFLNSVKLWALAQLGQREHTFELDLHAEVFESCAYHFWGLKKSPAKKLGILILGGGVPKNFSLQPEPTLSQIFRLPDIAGYDYDVQIVGASVTDGSLSGCKAQEAHTWGKVSAEALVSNVESLQADYSQLMPAIAWALLDKRRRMLKMREELGMAELSRRHPEAAGYIRAEGQLRLFDRREELTAQLFKAIGTRASLRRINRTLDFPLPSVDDEAARREGGGKGI